MKRLDKIPSKYKKEITDDLEKLAATIQNKRESLGYTQESLAEKLEIGVSTLKHIEQRIRFPSLPLLHYICRVLELKIKIN